MKPSAMTRLEIKSGVNQNLYKNPDFVRSYGWNRTMMHLIGGWPEENDNFFMRNRLFFNSLAIMLLINLPQTATLPVVWGDLNAVIDFFSVNLAVNLSLMKIIWLGIHRSTITNLLKLMAEDWLMETTHEEREEMVKMTKIIGVISSLSFYGTLSLFATYIPAQIVLQLQLKDDPNVDSRLSIGFLYNCVFPFDTSSLSVFLPIWICQFFMTYVSMAGYSSPDSFLVMLVFHQCGQLRVLRRRLERICDEKTLANSREFWIKIREIVNRQMHLNARVSAIEEKFHKVFLAVTLSCILTACTQAFVVITMLQSSEDGFPVTKMIFLLILATYDLGHFFIYCLAGDVLMNESSKFGETAYNSRWYDLSTNEAKSVLIFTSRSRLPQQISAGKFTVLSLPLFTTIVQTAMSYLSVLLALKV
ncbi:odorant receptor 67c-like [Diachasmimorpha longicaudata]|uniref:odorant receptor 67c-like n=1 Tax=Diachasmimorpha longicaudata TaxID=58733 RepID=UPI0030B8BE5C